MITILDPLGVPAVGLESLQDVLGEGALGVTICMSVLARPNSLEGQRHTDGDVVVIVDGNQVAKLQVASSGCSFACNTLHSAAIAEEHVGVVVDQLVTRLVEDSCSVRLPNSETDGIGETLAKRASRDFDTGSVVGFWVTGSDAVDLLQPEMSGRSRRQFIKCRPHLHGSS